jgi:hypothetical protein
VHELHLLPDDVLTRAEQCARFLHEVVHERYHAVDIETSTKHSTLLADIHSAMESRGLEKNPTHGHRTTTGDTP